MEQRHSEEKLGIRKERCPPSSPMSAGHRAHRNAIAEAIAQAHGGSVVSHDDGSGTVRMKIVVTKQQLRQMVLSMGRSGAAKHSQAPRSLEQQLRILRRRHAKRAEPMKGHRSSWRPALHSIPEEL